MATSDELAQIDISTEEKDKLVAEVMRYALFKTHQNSGCPIKREELTQIITKNYRQRALPALVIKEAGDRLAATFGYEMRELQRTRATSTRSGRPSSQQPSNQDAKSYVLVSKLDPEVYSKYLLKEKIAGPEGHSMVYELAERALDESISSKLKEYISQG
uniref:Uncharacterized protein n=1 Tax=Aegilops tauschii TaxID=37682 RepID=M8ATU6_AEGTA